MKKLLLIFSVALLFASCTRDPGTISGVVTYFFNHHQGYRPDVGAQVFVTKISCDTLSKSLTAMSIQEQILLAYMNIEKNEDFIKRYEDLTRLSGRNFDEEISEIQNMNEIYRENIESQNTLLEMLAKNEEEYESLINAGRENLFRVKFDFEYTHGAKVDGSGNYSIQVPPGEYYIVIISAGRQGSAFQATGRVYVRAITVKSRETVNVNARFSL